jgi:tryptophan-rich sensory protein
MKTNSKTFKILIIVASILIVAILGSIFVNLGMDWYATLTRPSEWVPDILIPIMWTIIYLSFAIILAIWVNKTTLPKSTLILLIVNGIINVLWCLLFFTFKLILIGNITIILNLIFAILLTINIYKNQKYYAYILSIYPLWVSIATTLNTAIWILN